MGIKVQKYSEYCPPPVEIRFLHPLGDRAGKGEGGGCGSEARMERGGRERDRAVDGILE